MARPLKSGVDYFPLDVKMDDEIELLESDHNIVGFGVLIKLYQRIYAHNYWLKWDKKEVSVFSNRVNVDKNEVIAIINTCLEWDILNKELFDEYSILTSNGIQKRFFEIVKRRTSLEIVNEFLLMKVPVRERQKIVIVDINSLNVRESTQRKGKERKGKDSEEDILCDNAFEKWWLSYPKRNGRRIGKKDAKKKFLNLNRDQWNDLKTATTNYTDYLKNSGLSACDAKRFLNETWKEYISPADESENKSKKSHGKKPDDIEDFWKEQFSRNNEGPGDGQTSVDDINNELQSETVINLDKNMDGSFS
jgi:hypothetical protein